MDKNRGFSLPEVLVSLVLITSTSLALLKQQWHIGQRINQLKQHERQLCTQDNAFERARMS